MNSLTKQQKRILSIIAMVLGVGLIVYFVLNAFNENITLYKSSSELKEMIVTKQQLPEKIRLGGMVMEGSLEQLEDNKVRFVVSDMVEDITVEYQGILPDLFKEGQGAIMDGKMNKDDIFIADNILAKHDENYMPPELAQ